MRHNKKVKARISILVALIFVLCMAGTAFAANPAAAGNLVWKAGDQCSVNASALNFRTGPGMNYKVIKSYTRGSLMTIAEKSGDWYKVTAADGKVGYVFGRYLLATTQAAAPAKAAPSVTTPKAEVTAQPPAKAVSGELIISAAASLTDAMNEMKGIYEKQNQNVKLTFNFGSSGALQQQIEQGAPADVFISAATKQMKALQDKKLIVDESCKNLLKNRLVLVGPKESAKVKGFSTLKEASLISIGEPDSVPAGKYAKETLTKMGLWDALKDKVVYAKDVRQVLAYVESGNVEAGMVYLTDAKISDKVQILSIAEENTHTPIVYPAAVVKGTKNPEAAQSFVDFLSSDAAKEVFAKYGFSLVK